MLVALLLTAAALPSALAMAKSAIRNCRSHWDSAVEPVARRTSASRRHIERGAVIEYGKMKIDLAKQGDASHGHHRGTEHRRAGTPGYP